MTSARTCHIATDDPELAVAELRAAFAGQSLDALIFFCSATYDLPRLAAALVTTFSDVACVVGCTSPGQIGPRGFERGGLTAMGFVGGDVAVTPFVIEPLSVLVGACDEIGHAVSEQRGRHPGLGAFGLLLVDGLSLVEEQLTASLYAALGDVPIIGASAGDDLAFVQTSLFIDGAFRPDRAIFLLCETALPFTAFRFQHFKPTEQLLVVTRADATNRVIYELNGIPALQAYASALGLQPGDVRSAIWSEHPLLVSMGGEAYVRSIQRVHDDDSLKMACAIDEGIVLRIGASNDPIATADASIAAARARVRSPQLVIGCDCILRLLELENKGLLVAMSEVLARHQVFGISGYGEQFNGVHVNQTFAGIVIGSAA